MLYCRTNPMKHKVTSHCASEINVLASFDWWALKWLHSFRLIHWRLKKAQTSLTFTGFSWFTEQTLQVKEDNSSPHVSCLMTSFNPHSVSVLQHSFNKHIVRHTCDLRQVRTFSVLLGHLLKQTFVHERKIDGPDRDEEEVKLWGCSCRMKGNHSAVVQMGLFEKDVLLIGPLRVSFQPHIILVQAPRTELRKEGAEEKKSEY